MGHGVLRPIWGSLPLLGCNTSWKERGRHKNLRFSELSLILPCEVCTVHASRQLMGVYTRFGPRPQGGVNGCKFFPKWRKFPRKVA